MSKKEPSKPKQRVSNQVYWVERNLKFIREHSIVMPEQMKLVTHIKVLIVVFTTLMIFLILSLILKLSLVPFIIILNIIIFLFLTDAFLTSMRASKFRNELLKRGGEMINPINVKIMKFNGTIPNLIAMIFILLLVLLYSGAWVYREISGINISSSFTTAYFNFYFAWFYTYTINNIGYSSPFIFMDINEGMLFGGALFSYDVLSDIRPTGINNGFELYYNDKKVAWGKMLPDDIEFMLEIISVYQKYRDKLIDEQSILSLSGIVNNT